MLMSFYQKYRSEKIEDLDLTSVRTVFSTMMNSGEIAHAYLFIGPRGLGKTSSARILARLVNCEKNYTSGKLNRKLVEPCNECDACVSIKNGSAVDVMEIDAASHRGIDDIRDLRDRVNLAPSALPKKVYIIDEVHMLTTEAFNALLKTLEEPPAHVMFILCTTEAHKVPETIVSRCVRVNFTKATTLELVRSLERAVKGEGLKVSGGALEELASGLDGSFREGHKLLEQLANQFSELTVENVRKSLNSVGSGQVEEILNLVRGGETEKIVEVMEGMESGGSDVVSLVTKLLRSLQISIRKDVASGKVPSRTDTRLVKKLIRVISKIKTSPLPLLPLELMLEEEALRHKVGAGGGGGKVVEKVVVVREKPVEKVVEKSVESKPAEERVEVAAQPIIEVEDVVITEEVTQDKIVSSVDFEQVVSGWQELISRLTPKNHSVAGLLRSAKPKEIKDKFLTIEVFYKFHKDQLELDARRRAIEEEMSKMWGPISVKCVLGEKGAPNAKVVEARPQISVAAGGENSQGVSEAEEVFGL